ncbi:MULTISPECIES: signal peptidase I [Bacillaceae]|uniref:Signal peptidase I n=1 Tax=Metabacillus sediminis TaxID=3117746 RepID=A0ABZ2NL20_9BACI|nr:signal peptidase I [Bacillus sp. SJS]KZZ83131.1 S26 family signal peptidase [Bacillus sp. SJS]
MSDKSAPKKKKSPVLEWIIAIAVAVLLAVSIRIFIFEPYVVDGDSMDPTLKNTEKLFVNKAIHYIGKFDRGDIVIINGKENKEHYVKRIIGLPGDTVEVKNDVLYVNGKEVKEPYLNSNRKAAQASGLQLTNDFQEVKVPKNKYFVMGDNRLVSMDSRTGLGLIEADRVIGKSEFVMLPFNKIRATN